MLCLVLFVLCLVLFVVGVVFGFVLFVLCLFVFVVGHKAPQAKSAAGRGSGGWPPVAKPPRPVAKLLDQFITVEGREIRMQSSSTNSS